MQKIRKSLPYWILGAILAAGLCLIAYPTLSNWWYERNARSAAVSYEKIAADLNLQTGQQILEEARAYNEKLAADTGRWNPDEQEHLYYGSLLDITGDGMMGTLEIPEIQCLLPIYHSADEASLQAGVGHMEGSSLPVGGESTHAVLSAHSGLPSAKLFTRLDELEIGDIFRIYSLSDVLSYEVDQILVVEPDETDALNIEEGEDLVTLITCTPYGINTHRLLVRGHRIEEEKVPGLSETSENPYSLMIVLIFAAVLLAVFIYLLHNYVKKRKS